LHPRRLSSLTFFEYFFSRRIPSSELRINPSVTFMLNFCQQGTLLTPESVLEVLITSQSEPKMLAPLRVRPMKPISWLRSRARSSESISVFDALLKCSSPCSTGPVRISAAIWGRLISHNAATASKCLRVRACTQCHAGRLCILLMPPGGLTIGKRVEIPRRVPPNGIGA
jgi:hypothetical protein